MNVLALCSGGLGLELGLKEVFPEARIVCAVEREAFAVANMVAKIESGSLAPFPIWSDVRSFDGKPWCGVVDCITAGYPCQPFSVAGKRKGVKDERNLWPNIARIIGEVRPSFVVCENVPNHLHYGFDHVVKNMEEMDYTVAAVLSTAWSVGAPHIRERLFWIGFSTDSCCEDGRWEYGGRSGKNRKEKIQSDRANPQRFVTNPDSIDGNYSRHGSGTLRARKASGNRVPFRITESPVCRADDGMANRVDRLRLCGNGVVPQQAAMSIKFILEEQ